MYIYIYLVESNLYHTLINHYKSIPNLNQLNRYLIEDKPTNIRID